MPFTDSCNGERSWRREVRGKRREGRRGGKGKGKSGIGRGGEGRGGVEGR